MTPYDWEADLERDRQRFYAVLWRILTMVGAALLILAGVYLLMVGRFAGWLLLVVGAGIAATVVHVDEREAGP